MKVIILVLLLLNTSYGMLTYSTPKYEKFNIFLKWEKEEILAKSGLIFGKVELVLLCLNHTDNFKEYTECTEFSATQEAIDIGFNVFKRETLESLTPVLSLSKEYRKCIIDCESNIDIQSCKTKINLALELMDK